MKVSLYTISLSGGYYRGPAVPLLEIFPRAKAWGYDGIELEAKRLLAVEEPGPLVLPAYEHTLKCSHWFNVLQARGVVSQTERAGYIARIRELARGCAETYLASRASRGFPMLTGADRALFVEGSHA